MKFIPGNQFINSTPRFGKYFKSGIIYTIKHIKKEEDKIKYIFSSEKGDKEILFSSVKEADDFLGNF